MGKEKTQELANTLNDSTTEELKMKTEEEATKAQEKLQELGEKIAEELYEKINPAAGSYLVVDGATCNCSEGTIPEVRIPITSHKKYFANDKLVATIDDSMLIAPFFGTCKKKSTSGDTSCTYAPAPWKITKGDGHPQVGEKDVLIANGKIQCSWGGKIKVVKHGQQTQVTESDSKNFSRDIVDATNCLMWTYEMPDELQAVEEVKVKMIKYDTYQGDGKINFKERSAKQLILEAIPSSGNPQKINWAVKKKEEETWTIYNSYGRKIPLKFRITGEYTIVAYGTGRSQFEFDSVKKDKGCYLKADIIDENTISGFDVNKVFVENYQILQKNNPASIIPLLQLPPSDLEKRALIVDVLNGEKESELVLINSYRGDSAFSIDTSQETVYRVRAHFEGEEETKKEIKITIEESRVNADSIFPTDSFISQGDKREFSLSLKTGKYNPEKIVWNVDGVERYRGEKFSYTFPKIMSGEKKYTIGAFYDNRFSDKRIATREITAIKNTIERVEIAGIGSEHLGVLQRTYTISLHARIPYKENIDGPVAWSISFTPEESKAVSKGEQIATMKSPSSCEPLIMLQEKFTFTAHNSLQFSALQEGIYKISVTLNGKEQSYDFTIKKSEVVEWRFVDENNWELSKLSYKKPFKIELGINGWENTEINPAIYIEYDPGFARFMKNQIVSLAKLKLDGAGKGTISIASQDDFWKKIDELKVENTIKKIAIVLGGESIYTFDGQRQIHKNLSFYLPPKKNRFICPEVTLDKDLFFEGRFAEANNETLHRIVKYGESVKAQIRVIKGYGEEAPKDSYLFSLYQYNTWKDTIEGGYNKTPVSIDSAKKIIDIPIDTNKLGEAEHVKDKSTEYNPRLFYFKLEEKGNLVRDPDKLEYPSTLTRPNIIKHDGKSDEEIDKTNQKRLTRDYFKQLKVAKDTTLNQSLNHSAMVIIGEPLNVDGTDCGGKNCLSKDNYKNYPGVSADKVGKLIQEINIRLAGFGGNVPTTEFDDRTEETIKQFQRDYMKVPETGRICGNLLVAIDDFCTTSLEISFSSKSKDNGCGCRCSSKGKNDEDVLQSKKMSENKCSDFGDKSNKGVYVSSSNLEKSHAYEYPGIHRSLLFALKGIDFYLKKNKSSFYFWGINSGYRCRFHPIFKKDKTTNHMGKAIDIGFGIKGKKITDAEQKFTKDECIGYLKKIRDQSILKHMFASEKWSKANSFSTEPIGGSWSTSWIHLDVREFDKKYLADEYFSDTYDKLIKGSLVEFAKNLGFQELTLCKGANFKKPETERKIRCTSCKALTKDRKDFYEEFGESAINMVKGKGKSNKFKGLYMIAQRRKENSFNLDVPNNNPMNIKGKGDLGSANLKTTEHIDGQNISMIDGFANFTTVEKGFEGYLNLLESNFSSAYDAILDDTLSIDDFLDGLQDKGKRGVYATDPDYKSSIKTIYEGVVKDYKKWYDCKLRCSNHASQKVEIEKDIELLNKIK